MLLSSLIAAKVQVDMGQVSSSAPDFVKNKPALGTAAAAATTDFDASGAAASAQSAAATDATSKASSAQSAAISAAATDATTKAYTAVEQTKLGKVRYLGFKLAAVSLNSVADTAITGLPAKWRPVKLSAFDASTTPGALAVVGLFTAATGGGTNLLAAFTLTGLTGATKIADGTLISITDYRTETTVYLRNTVVNGSAVTASFVLFIEDLT